MITLRGKIPLFIHPIFWVLMILLAWINSSTPLTIGIWSIVIFISVLVHEYGHALMALYFGQRAEIHLVALGGVTKRNGAPLSLLKEFILVLAGPLAGFMLFIIAELLLPYVSSHEAPYSHYFLYVLANANLFWTILNLVPVFPLDGGQLMKIVLEGSLGIKGVKIAFMTSLIVATIIGLFFFTLQNLLVGIVFLSLAFESYRLWEGVRSMSSEDTNKEIKALLDEAIEDFRMGHQDIALEKFVAITEVSKKGVIFNSAKEHIGRIYAHQEQIEGAYDILSSLKNNLSDEGKEQLQKLAYALNKWDEAISLGNELYQKQPSIDVALTNARAQAMKKQPVPTVGWLRNATLLGFKNVKELMTHSEFDSIREAKEFRDWMDHQG